jgi:ABC-type transport system substrate-binding protein
MSSAVQLLDAAGRRRSPATLSDFHAGRAPGNKGQRYAADSPTVDEIIAVMRQARQGRCGNRLNGLIVVLWRAGLGINEALSLIDTDLEERHGIPTPTDGGRTYAFRIRPGIRYSDGQELGAGDFRRGIERLFRVRSPGTFLYDGLVGAKACRARPRCCNLAQGVVTDDSTGTVTFRFTAPDPEFLYHLTEYAFSAPVPLGTLDYETGSRSVPGTGP